MNRADLPPDVYASPEVHAVLRLHRDLFTDEFRRLPIRDQLERQAERLRDAQAAGQLAAATHFTCWHPDLVGRSAEEILGRDLSLNDAQETIAREYGFADWSDVEKRATEPPAEEFEAAVDALLVGDVESLRAIIKSKPSLVREQSRYGHRSTLLHYVGSNGVETHRQVVPRNLAEVAKLLLDAGADVNAVAEMYGGGSTTIALLITSSHPAEAGVRDDVVKVLVDAGAETDGS